MLQGRTPVSLLHLLADGEYHSGVELAEALGISRSAVWKQIHGLEQSYGLTLESQRSKGYRLSRPLQLLDVDVIRSQLQLPAYPSPIYVHETIGSTNSWLMAQAENGMAAGTVCLAERQTSGRGRHGRNWVSPFGSNIYLSLMWRYDLPMSHLSGLSIACGVAVAQGLSDFGVSQHALKWPNDVLWQRKKLAGLLMEAKGEVAGPSTLVMGVGVNTHMSPEQAVSIDQPWTSLAQIPEVDAYNRNRLAALLIDRLRTVMESFPNTGLKPFLRTWSDYDGFLGERICVQIGSRQMYGDYLGLADDGGVRVSINGKTQEYNVGEVRLTRAKS